MKVSKGFERFYSSDVLLYLRKTLYGVKNAAKAFWRFQWDTNEIALILVCTKSGTALWV